MLNNLTSITFEFNINEKNQTLLKRVFGSLTIDRRSRFFPNASASARTVHIFVANESLFESDINHSYRCNSKTKIDNFKNDDKNVTIKSIDIENLRVQPFANMATPFHDYAAGKLELRVFVRLNCFVFCLKKKSVRWIIFDHRI